MHLFLCLSGVFCLTQGLQGWEAWISLPGKVGYREGWGVLSVALEAAMSGLTVLGPFDVCLSLLPGLAVAGSRNLHTCVFFAACLQLCSYPILDHIHLVFLLAPSSLE